MRHPARERPRLPGSDDRGWLCWDNRRWGMYQLLRSLRCLLGACLLGHARKMYVRSGGGPNGEQGVDQDSMHWWE